MKLHETKSQGYWKKKNVGGMKYGRRQDTRNNKINKVKKKTK